jgi:hypothetical protein
MSSLTIKINKDYQDRTKVVEYITTHDNCPDSIPNIVITGVQKANKYSDNHNIDMEVEGREGGGLTFDFLAFLSSIFNTKNINIGESRRSDGCDTCGHGETTTIEIHILEAFIPVITS